MGMPYKIRLPQINMVVQKDENSVLAELAKQYNLPKASVARIFMRMGMELLNNNPEKSLAFAQVDGC
jgi:hypothetical protein